MEISLEYWNKLAEHTILICSLLSGFSITVVATLLIYESKKRIAVYTLLAATLAASCFLISLFAWTKVLMMSTEGYPLHFDKSSFDVARLIGGASILIGILCISIVIALSGWMKSKKTGICTTIIGIITFLFILFMIT